MGEYHLKQAEANHLINAGHEVYLLEQLNGQNYNDEYVQQIKDLAPDAMYYGPLDQKTFEVVEQIDCKKILHMNSKGIFQNLYEDVVNAKDKYWTHLMSTSKTLHDAAKKVTKNVEHIEYCFSALKEEECTFDPALAYDCAFLGQGHHRLTIPEFAQERNIYFSDFQKTPNFNFALYGTGWPHVLPYYKGVLPAGKIGSLYSSIKCGISVIEGDQHIYGMVNNRYTEMGICECPIITFNYKDIDWHGAEEYLNFVSSADEFEKIVNLCVNDDEKIIKKTKDMKKFLQEKHKVYFEKLEYLLGN